MTSKSSREELDRLASAIVDDLLDTADEDLMAELEPGDAAAILSEGRDILQAAKRKAGREVLAQAREHLNREASARRHARRGIAPDIARRRLSAIVANSSADSRVTLAARDGRGVPDQDLDGLVEDARDLGFDFDSEMED